MTPKATHPAQQHKCSAPWPATWFCVLYCWHWNKKIMYTDDIENTGFTGICSYMTHRNLCLHEGFSMVYSWGSRGLSVETQDPWLRVWKLWLRVSTIPDKHILILNQNWPPSCIFTWRPCCKHQLEWPPSQSWPNKPTRTRCLVWYKQWQLVSRTKHTDNAVDILCLQLQEMEPVQP